MNQEDNPYFKEKKEVDAIIKATLGMIEITTEGLDSYQLFRVLDEICEDLNQQRNVLEYEINCKSIEGR